jgi:hypothetical protein
MRTMASSYTNRSIRSVIQALSFWVRSLPAIQSEQSRYQVNAGK